MKLMRKSGKAKASDDGVQEHAAKDGSSSVIQLLLTASLVILALALTYSVSTNANWRALPATAMIASASIVSGGLIGLLFGVPRSLGGGPPPSTPPGAAGPGTPDFSVVGIAANTNLEQISDWLTKIIVGVTLTQFGAIRRGASSLFNGLAPALGGDKQAPAFAGALVVYFSVAGFLIGWLFARLRLGVAMSNADALLALSRRAIKAGDADTARAAQEAAKASITSTTIALGSGQITADVERLADDYEQIRANAPSSPRRTAQMEDIVRSARQLARAGQFSPQDVSGWFRTGSEGRRLVALALMEGDSKLVDVPIILDAISAPKSAFEQYHALTIANTVLSSLSHDEQTQFAAAVDNPQVSHLWAEDSSRTQLAGRIRSRVGEL